MVETFKLSKRTLSVLENFSKINPAIVFRKGQTLSTITPSNAPDMFAFAKIEETIPAKFGVIDISRFLSILSLYNEPTLSVNDLVLNIHDERKRKFSYTLTADKMIKSITEFEFPTSFAEFTLSASDLLALKKHVEVADLPNIFFTGDGKTIVVKGTKAEDSTSDQYLATIGEHSKKFNIHFMKWKITNLIDADYTVSLAENVVRFSGNNVDYYIAPELESDYS